MPTRRELLWGLAGAVGATAAGALWRGLEVPRAGAMRTRALAAAADSVTHGPYGHGVEPPRALGPAALDAATIPPPPVRGPVERTLTITQRPVEVAEGVVMEAWTFDGGIPGPILRVTEGERLTLHVRNLTAHPHNLHLHGAHDPAQDGWEPIAPGAQRTYVLNPRPFGLYPYHCDLRPGAQHIGRGLYGVLIVDPPQWRPPAAERVLVLGGFDADGDGMDDLYGWNGVAGYFGRHPLRLPRGEPVRLYVANLVTDDPPATFHLHANVFDVFRSGTRLAPDERTDAVTLALGERAVLEARFESAGRYMFHPHQGRMAERGGMGWVVVT